MLKLLQRPVLALCLVAAATPVTRSKDSRFITLEEHYDPPSARPYEDKVAVYDLLLDAYGTSVEPTLRNISLRIPSMNENNIGIQVVSNDPEPLILELPAVATIVNNELASAIAEYPNRFRGFCFLPMAHPLAAAQELQRCVLTHGFLGALVDSHLINNTFYDGEEYDPLWSMFTRLDVPFYMHPTYPPISQVNGSLGLYAPDHGSYSYPDAAIVGTTGWGWHSDTGLALVKMWFSGTFDRHPDIKVVVGHMGENIPYMLERVNSTLGRLKPDGVTVLEAYAKNVWVTTSGFFSLVPFHTLWAATAPDRIMYSVDYPWAPNEAGSAFMAALNSSGLVTQEQFEGIAYGNAEKLLKLSSAAARQT